MSKEEYKELLEYIDKNHGWKHMRNKNDILIKYVKCSYDTKDEKIWFIQFNNDENLIFRTEQDYDLKEKVYEYLNGGQVL